MRGRHVYPEDGYITIYVENDTADAEFYIDDVSFHPDEGVEFTADTGLPSLAEIYKDHFLIGSAFTRSDLTGQRFELVKHHFNVMTAANDMKPDALTGNEKGEYNFGRADTMLEQLEQAGILVHGHTLVWHAQSPDWLNKDQNGELLTRAQAKANMQEFIGTVAGHFAGRVISWDVVNEAFQVSLSGSVPSDWRSALRKGGSSGEHSAWYGAYENGADIDAGESGADYIYDAFVFTRLADPDAILYYNDFNETEPVKREVIAMMAEELNEKWKTDPRNDEPDRLLIEGLGMQAHYWTNNLDANDVRETIQRWSSTGAEISITELDIPAGDWNSYTPLTLGEEMKQALLYAQLFRVFKQFSDEIARVTFWGIDDATSWRSEGGPLLFDAGGNAKLAFFAVMDPEGAMDGNLMNYLENEEEDEEPEEDSFKDMTEDPPKTPPPPPLPEPEPVTPPQSNTLWIILIITGVVVIAASTVFILFKSRRG